ncbi:hypothetical protein SPI_04503 [Niveomyces insectorum RCEF 264]|uniref:Uncharacterized protein n=1 Tax=Niveomyces insectorum RCEF 264 TaxID=1081102 RepID=A0A167UJR9_9HYPO|nr:hypothetical protein SPI_04503 [Niveomyces insectorum RCEF 264]
MCEDKDGKDAFASKDVEASVENDTLHMGPNAAGNGDGDDDGAVVVGELNGVVYVDDGVKWGVLGVGKEMKDDMVDDPVAMPVAISGMTENGGQNSERPLVGPFVTAATDASGAPSGSPNGRYGAVKRSFCCITPKTRRPASSTPYGPATSRKDVSVPAMSSASSASSTRAATFGNVRLAANSKSR